MVCVAVTRMGWGSVFRFADARSAFLHPVIQYGDAIISDAETLLGLYRPHEWRRLISFVGMQNEVSETESRSETLGRLFRGLVKMAEDPPNTIEALVTMVAQDRSVADDERRSNRAMSVESTEDGGSRTIGRSTT